MRLAEHAVPAVLPCPLPGTEALPELLGVGGQEGPGGQGLGVAGPEADVEPEAFVVHVAHSRGQALGIELVAGQAVQVLQGHQAAAEGQDHVQVP